MQNTNNFFNYLIVLTFSVYKYNSLFEFINILYQKETEDYVAKKAEKWLILGERFR